MNPFIEEVSALEREQKHANKELLRLKTEQAWFVAFDIEKANTEVRRFERVEAEAQARLARELQIEVVKKDLVAQLVQKASLGMDPRYWFSAERAIARRKVAQIKRELTGQGACIAKLREDINNVAEQRRIALIDLQKARRFDPLNAEGAIATLHATLDQIEPRLEILRRRRDDLDQVIRVPLAELREKEREYASCDAAIKKAEEFEAALNRASDGRERWKIHQQCEKELGDGQPGNVLRAKRGELRRLDAGIGKLLERIGNLVRIAKHDIRHIVIDGNNLCYQGGNHFIEFKALESLVPLIAQKYEVTLIFDASIRRLMRMRNQDVAARFPQARQVHVVASKQKADEIILSLADEDDHTYVVSNDNFVDYPEMMAVKKQRVLRHDILDQSAYISALHIKTRFDDPARRT